VRSVYSLKREQIDFGTWHSVEYGFEAPCNAQGTYRAEVSSVRYSAQDLLDSYAFLIRSQGGFEIAGSLTVGYEAAKLVRASGVVHGNSCQFTVCAAAECGVLDTSQLGSVKGEGGAGSEPSPSAGAAGSMSSAGAGGSGPPRPGSSTGGRSGFPGAPSGTGGSAGRASSGTAGRSTGGSGSGFPPPP
jgi:hypothetical protein